MTTLEEIGKFGTGFVAERKLWTQTLNLIERAF